MNTTSRFGRSMAALLFALSVITCAPSGSTRPPTQAPSSVAPPAPSIKPAGIPAVPTWAQVTSMVTARSQETATLLLDGTVLVVGGKGSAGYLGSAELFDPSTGTWTTVGSLTTPRGQHTATLLPDGTVLVVGGRGKNGALQSAELFDPTTRKWSPAGVLSTPRYGHTATLLLDGRVLIAGGENASGTIKSVELYDPKNHIWTPGAPLNTARAEHTATRLSDGTGDVVVLGGIGASGTYLATAERYSVKSNQWTAYASGMPTTRARHTATLLSNGQILVVGGNDGSQTLATVELFDPSRDIWTDAMQTPIALERQTATLAPDGTVYVTGGFDGTAAVDTVERYDPADGAWTNAGTLDSARADQTATLLPSGQILVVGGSNPSGPLASADLLVSQSGTWSSAASLTSGAAFAASVLLPNGKVLVTGGVTSSGDSSAAALFNPTQASWTQIAPLAQARERHTATLLMNGKVLVAGGTSAGAPLASSEIYDPSSGKWTTTGAMKNARADFTATLLPDGKVLVTGGTGTSGLLATSEFYDPASGTWSFTNGQLSDARANHTATLLPDGKVLVSGGAGVQGAILGSAELFDPRTGLWSATGSLTPREQHTATLLPNGEVLVAGGFGTTGELSSTELFDPLTGQWSVTGSLLNARKLHRTVLLRDGKVLVMGGEANSAVLASTELYDPATGKWSTQGDLATTRESLTATVLLDGSVLVAGGTSGSAAVQASERFIPEGAGGAGAPTLTPPSVLFASQPLNLPGSALRGLSGGSSGATNASATDYPLISLQAIEGSRTVWLPESTFASDSVQGNLPAIPSGYYVLSVFVEGLSTGSVVRLDNPPIAPQQNVSTPEDTSLAIALRGTDVDDDPLTYTVVTQPIHGTLTGTPPTLTYTPTADYDGTDAFTYEVNDGVTPSSAGTISISVTPVDDAPVATAANLSTDQDAPVSFTLGGTDVESDPLTFTLASVPTHGKLTGALPDVTYTPDPGWIGADSFTFVADDGQLQSAPAEISLTTKAVNHAPVAASADLSTPEDTPLAITLSATDADGNPLTYTVVSQPKNGALSGTAPALTYTPGQDWNGTDSFTFQANDGKLDSEVTTVSLIVTAVDDAPVVKDFSVSTQKDTAVDLSLSGTDVEKDALTYSVTELPQHGKLTGTPPTLSYHPDKDFTGSDEITFVANDGTLSSEPAKVTLTVQPPASGCGCNPVAGSNAAPGALLALLLLGLASARKRRA